MPDNVNVDTVNQPTPTREELKAAHLQASLEGRYQDAVDYYKAFSNC